ncbi:MAG: (d)CMP kinase [Candidatus Liberibacter ctenarytainae]|uniref:Cytidylate kinase n=1 Tax=Candidatus Liberibacter ctenarytainae TaxID=2020335 RepID=A0A937AC51_9HYPH|nr:(d)CMP kinase [Candidatus Liberibacter ctenarytainae]
MDRVIAIDGTAAAGKGVLSRFIAHEYGFCYLETGLIYRAVAKHILDKDISLDDEIAAKEVAKNVVLSNLDKTELSSHEISEAAARIAAMPSVRQELIEVQRSFARTSLGAVIDGRDIGTVIVPDAVIKFYVTASLNVRAQRRYHEMIANGDHIDYDTVLEGLRKRDDQDKKRVCCPLVQDKDAYFFDTTEMSVDVMCKVAKGLIDTKLYSG